MIYSIWVLKRENSVPGADSLNTTGPIMHDQQAAEITYSAWPRRNKLALLVVAAKSGRVLSLVIARVASLASSRAASDRHGSRSAINVAEQARSRHGMWWLLSKRREELGTARRRERNGSIIKGRNDNSPVGYFLIELNLIRASRSPKLN